MNVYRSCMAGVSLVAATLLVAVPCYAATDAVPATKAGSEKPADTPADKAPDKGADKRADRASDKAPPACPTAEEYATVVVGGPIEVVYRSTGEKKTPVVPPVEPKDDKVPKVALRDEIAIPVANLKYLVQREKCIGSPLRKVVLFLDGQPVPGAYGDPPSDPSKDVMYFHLERNESTSKVWTRLLSSPTFTDRKIAVSLGFSDEYALGPQQTAWLRVIPQGWFWAWAFVVLVLMACFLLLAIKSDVIRDIGPQPGALTRKPYSLAKTQAAWWFFLILASYLFIGLVTGDYSSSITSTVLSLMGISSATAIGSATIDAGRAPAPVVAGVLAAAPVAARTKGHWWLDIVSDDNGVNFHRFQMAAWTAVLGIIFIHDVYEGLAMPDFSPTLLGLLGISAGTYLGLKTTSEK